MVAAAEVCGVHVGELRARLDNGRLARSVNAVAARKLCAWLLWHESIKSFPEIANLVYGSGHPTAYDACKSVESGAPLRLRRGDQYVSMDIKEAKAAALAELAKVMANVAALVPEMPHEEDPYERGEPPEATREEASEELAKSVVVVPGAVPGVVPVLPAVPVSTLPAPTVIADAGEAGVVRYQARPVPAGRRRVGCTGVEK